MPFVALASLKFLIPDALFDAFGENEEESFVKLEAEAAKIIRDGAGIDIPESTEDAPDWVITPAAWIIRFLARDMVSGVSPEYELRTNTNYKRAIEMIQSHNVASVKSQSARVGKMEDMFL